MSGPVISQVDERAESPVKERILLAAQQLFAQGGYSGYGVRDIAREARVSLSMVSYHFGSKLGILQSIFASFFAEYTTVLEESLHEAADLEQKVSLLVRATTRFMRKHQDVFRIVATELPHFPEEIAEFERQYLAMIRGLVHRWLAPDVYDALQTRPSDELPDGCVDVEALQTIVGPALLSMVYSTFLFGRALEKALCFTRDDGYYERYEELVSRLILAGLREVIGVTER